MKYKVLLMTLLSTLAIPYGTATAMDWKLRIPFANPYQIKVANEAQDQAAIALSCFDRQIGGNGAIDSLQRLKIFTEILGKQATSLEEVVNDLTTILADIPGDDLTMKITHLAQEREKEKMTNQILRQEIDARKREQAEMDVPLDDAPQQPLLPIHQLPPPEMQPLPYPMLSSYQQELLPRRDQIGEEAWKLLGGENPNLAAALLKRIQENQGIVDILCLEKNSFTLRLNGKVQCHPYKF